MSLSIAPGGAPVPVDSSAASSVSTATLPSKNPKKDGGDKGGISKKAAIVGGIVLGLGLAFQLTNQYIEQATKQAIIDCDNWDAERADIDALEATISQLVLSAQKSQPKNQPSTLEAYTYNARVTSNRLRDSHNLRIPGPCKYRQSHR